MEQQDKQRMWYAVQTYSGQENSVKVNLERRIESMQMEDKIFQ
ncbi:MAG: transcription termination/antitermination NusG family protein, partial [Bacillota bacterium]